jgi:hypothetical protein
MKKILFACFTLLAIGLLYFWKDIRGYSTLDKAVQSQWNTPVYVVNKDLNNKLLIFQDHDQYVFSVFHYRNGRYFYKNDSQSSGWTASSDNGPAFLVRVEPKNNKENFIWGALYSDTPIEKFQIEYINGEIQEVESVNNTFINKIPMSYEVEQELNLMTTFKNVKAYDKDNNLIRAWSN